MDYNVAQVERRANTRRGVPQLRDGRPRAANRHEIEAEIDAADDRHIAGSDDLTDPQAYE